MFNTEIYTSTFIFILILIIIIIQVLVSKSDQQKSNHKTRLLILLTLTIIYNIVEGLLPDKRFPIDLLTQNIIAFSVGVIAAFYSYYYLKVEFNINIIKPLDITKISYLMSISFILFFIIPYSATQNLTISRNIFLVVPLIILLLSTFNTLPKQFREIKEYDKFTLKFHKVAGIGGLMGVTSLPITILIFGDNQFIEQTSYTMGIFIMYIDYLFYDSRNKACNKINELENLTVREKEIFELVISKIEYKYSDISEHLHISEKTISTHLSNIYKKMEVKNKKELQERYSDYKF